MKYKNKHSLEVVDVVIPVYGRHDLLYACLSKLPDAFGNIPFSVTVVDNASPTNVSLPKVGFPLYLIENKTNLGFPKACNIGAKNRYSPLIFFLNDDCFLEPKSGEKLVSALDDKKVGIAGMRLKFPDTSDVTQNQFMRPAGKLQHICLSVDVRGQIYHPFLGWSADHPKVMGQKSVFAVTGAAMMVRRKLFHDAGMFDMKYNMGSFEDVDMCMTARKLGFDVITVPEALGIHYAGATSETHQLGFPQKQNYGYFMSKWQTHLLYWDFFCL